MAKIVVYLPEELHIFLPYNTIVHILQHSEPYIRPMQSPLKFLCFLNSHALLLLLDNTHSIATWTHKCKCNPKTTEDRPCWWDTEGLGLFVFNPSSWLIRFSAVTKLLLWVLVVQLVHQFLGGKGTNAHFLLSIVRKLPRHWGEHIRNYNKQLLFKCPQGEQEPFSGSDSTNIIKNENILGRKANCTTPSSAFKPSESFWNELRTCFISMCSSV